MILVRNSCAELYLREIEKAETCEEYYLGKPWEMKELSFHSAPLRIFYLPDRLSGMSPAYYVSRFYQSQKWMKSRLLFPVAAAAKAILQKR